MAHLWPLDQRLAALWPDDRRQAGPVVVAVSGGPDSVALLRAMARLHDREAAPLVVAHVNHGVRGDEAAADQAFVEALCRSLKLECRVGTVPPGAKAGGEGLESALRAARYAFLIRTAEAQGARYVAVAHTADDQAETILHHILRGTGLRGLAGMPRARALSEAVTLVRPLLEVSRAEVLDYLAALGQAFRSDATNQDRAFTRNRIRHELMPLLARDYAPAIIESLVRLGALAGEAQSIVELAAQAHFETSLVERDARHLIFDCVALAAAHRHLVRETFVWGWRQQSWPRQAMGFAQWDELAQMAIDAANTASARTFPGAIAAERRGGQLWLVAPAPARG